MRNRETAIGLKESGHEDFEQAKADVLRFLDTSYYALCQQLGVKEWIDPMFVVEEFKRKLERFISLAAGRPDAIDFIKDLLLKDKADDSQIPAAFKQSFEEYQKLTGEPNYVCDEYFGEDVVWEYWHRQNYDTGGSNRSYRTYYYAAIMEALAGFGKDGESAVVECLRDMDSVASVALVEGHYWVTHKGKLSKDWSKEEYESLERKAREQEDSGAVIVQGFKGQEERDESDIGEISEDRVEVFTGFLEKKEIYDQQEFTMPKQKAFEVLKQMEITETAVSYLVESIKTADADFRENFYDILEILNKKPNIAAKKLMSFIRQEENRYFKALATQALYHVELGRIGMSSEGVKYLGKTFDLGADNNSAYSCHRITGDGKVGIFDNDRRAVGFFQLRELDSPDEVLRTEMLNFTYGALFTPREDETSEERAGREQILEEFKQKYFETYLTGFHEETGVRFNNLNLPEQGWFLWYIQRADDAEKKRVKNFARKYREEGLKSFLSLEQNKDMGEAILRIGEKLEPAAARRVFHTYTKLAAEAEKVEDALQKFFVNQPDNRLDENKVTYEILKRAKDLLTQFADKAGAEAAEVISQLNGIKTDLITFAAIFKTAFRGKSNVEFNDIKGVSLEAKDSVELTDDEKDGMRAIFRGNRLEISPDFAEKRVRQEFNPVMREAGHKFYLLKKDGEIVSFARFDDLPNGNLYTGFINTATDIRGMNIGTAFLETVFRKEGGEKAIELKVRAENPSVKLYERLGFAVVGEPYQDLHTKKIYLKMIRHADRPQMMKPAVAAQEDGRQEEPRKAA